MATGNESQEGIPPHGIEGVLTCHENPPRGFPSLCLLPLAAKLGLRTKYIPVKKVRECIRWLLVELGASSVPDVRVEVKNRTAHLGPLEISK